MRYRSIQNPTYQIEATEWLEGTDHPVVVNLKHGDPRGWFENSSGWHTVQIGDWVVEGSKNEYYVVKPELFKRTYEPA